MDGPRQTLITHTHTQVYWEPSFLLLNQQPLISAVSIGTLDIQTLFQLVVRRHQSSLSGQYFSSGQLAVFVLFFKVLPHGRECPQRDFVKCRSGITEKFGSPASTSLALITPLTSAMMVSHRSTKGASKARRDHINNEIRNMRALLPITQEDRERLSYLHSMAAICTYIRKSVLFQGKSSNFTRGL